MRYSYALLLCLGTCVALAAEPEFDRAAMQGGVVRGKVSPGSDVRFNGDKIRVSANGNFVVGFGRDEPGRVTLEVREPGKEWQSYQVMVAKRSYEEQHISGLPQNKVTPNKEELKRIKQESRLVGTARSKDIEQEWFMERFTWPVYGRISGVYGSRRILNGKPRRPHYGVDVAAPTGTPIRAPASGMITLAHPDMFYSGGYPDNRPRPWTVINHDAFKQDTGQRGRHSGAGRCDS